MELPVGYRFHPTKEELVNYYLKGRVLGYADHRGIIPHIDICSYNPGQLPGIFHDESIIGPDDQVQKWWFFSPHTPDTARKVKRSTPSGYWKKTGDDKEVRAKKTGTVIGKKKFLVFHEGRGKNGVKTNWVIHEYHLLGNDVDRTHVLCRLKLKRDKKDESYLGIITLADFELDSDPEYSIDEALVQAEMNSLRELIQPENQVEFTSADFLRLLQPALGSQNNSFPSNIHQLTNTGDPSGMDTSLDNEEDEDVGDVQNADLAYAEDVLMNRRARTTDSVHGFFPLVERKGVVENKFNGSPFASEKPMPCPVTVAPRRPMAPPVRPASVICYSKDEEQRFEKVKRETAVINIKPERISLDETAARAKVLGYKERGSPGNSTKKTNSKEIEYVREISNSVTASTGTASESTKTSTTPPLANLVNVLIRIFLLLTIPRQVLNF